MIPKPLDRKRKQAKRKLSLERLETRELLAAQPFSAELIAERFVDSRPVAPSAEVRAALSEVLDGVEGQGNRLFRVVPPLSVLERLQTQGLERPRLPLGVGALGNVVDGRALPFTFPQRVAASLRGPFAERLASVADEVPTSLIGLTRSARAGLAGEIEQPATARVAGDPLATGTGIAAAPISVALAQHERAPGHEPSTHLASIELQRPSRMLEPRAADQASALQPPEAIESNADDEDWSAVLQTLALDALNNESGQESETQLVSIVTDDAIDNFIAEPITSESHASNWALFRFWDNVPRDVEESESEGIPDDTPMPVAEMRLLELVFADDQEDGMVAVDTLAAVPPFEMDTTGQLEVVESAFEIDRISGRVRAFEIAEVEAVASRVVQLPAQRTSPPVTAATPNSGRVSQSRVITTRAETRHIDHRAAAIPAMLWLVAMWRSRQLQKARRWPRWIEMLKVGAVKHLTPLSFFRKAPTTT